MSLLLVAEKLWRHKLVTLPIVAFVLVAGFYVMAMTPPVYEASTSFILVSPPAPPTADQIERDPKLARGANNPYTRYADQSIIVQILSTRLNSDEARRDLVKLGADPRYIVAPDVSFGFTAPIVQITGPGATPAIAVKTANLVGTALTRELARMQQLHSVAPSYQIDAQQIVAGQDAQLKRSGKLRSLFAVLALGAVLLFLAVSVLDAIATIRWRRAHPGEPPAGMRLAPAPFDSSVDGYYPGPTYPHPAPAPAPHAVPHSRPERTRPGTSAWDAPRNGEAAVAPVARRLPDASA